MCFMLFVECTVREFGLTWVDHIPSRLLYLFFVILSCSLIIRPLFTYLDSVSSFLCHSFSVVSTVAFSFSVLYSLSRLLNHFVAIYCCFLTFVVLLIVLYYVFLKLIYLTEVFGPKKHIGDVVCCIISNHTHSLWHIALLSLKFSLVSCLRYYYYYYCYYYMACLQQHLNLHI